MLELSDIPQLVQVCWMRTLPCASEQLPGPASELGPTFDSAQETSAHGFGGRTKTIAEVTS